MLFDITVWTNSSFQKLCLELYLKLLPWNKEKLLSAKTICLEWGKKYITSKRFSTDLVIELNTDPGLT